MASPHTPPSNWWSEIGTDMGRWPTAQHFTSWLTLAPKNKVSGGRLLSSRTQPSANRAAVTLRLAAASLAGPRRRLELSIVGWPRASANRKRSLRRRGSSRSCSITCSREISSIVIRARRATTLNSAPAYFAACASMRNQLGFALLSRDTGEVLGG